MTEILTWTVRDLLPLVIGAVGFHVLGGFLALMAILRGRTSQGTIAWLMGLAFIPYIAVPLYLIIGFRRLDGYNDARREGDATINHLGADLLKRTADVPWLRIPEQEPEASLARLARLPVLDGNRIELFGTGAATFDSIIAGIRQAQHYVLVQFFIIRDDSLGRRLADALIERAEAGCQVYFLDDAVGSHALSRRYRRRLRQAGVQVARFTSGRGFLHRFRVNFRNHRKIVVVDGQAAWVGGHNVGDEYVDAHGHWRDTHLHMDGPAALAAQLSFVEDWYWATDQLPQLHWEVTHHEDGSAVIVLTTGPSDEQETAQLALVQMINQCQHRCWLSSPYLVPDEAVMVALRLAVVRGVDVRLLVPAEPDHRVVWWAGQSFVAEALRGGMRVGAYAKGFLHQKAWLFDDALAMVGTTNLDNRSLHLNFEIMVGLLDAADIKAMAELLQQDWSACKEYDAQWPASRPLWRRLLYRMARLAAPLL